MDICIFEFFFFYLRWFPYLSHWNYLGTAAADILSPRLFMTPVSEFSHPDIDFPFLCPLLSGIRCQKSNHVFFLLLTSESTDLQDLYWRLSSDGQSSSVQGIWIPKFTYNLIYGLFLDFHKSKAQYTKSTTIWDWLRTLSIQWRGSGAQTPPSKKTVEAISKLCRCSVFPAHVLRVDVMSLVWKTPHWHACCRFYTCV